MISQNKQGAKMSEKQILDKSDNIQEDQNKSSALSNASFGLALVAIALGGVQDTTKLGITVASVIIGCIGLAGFIWSIAKWRLAERG